MAAERREVGLLVMAYGTPSGPEDVARFFTDIRGGRASSPDQLAELRARYRAIGDVVPLARITTEQAERTCEELSRDPAGPEFRAYVGMKHSSPSIEEAVSAMVAGGAREAVAIVMAPHYSRLSVGSYVERLRAATAPGGPEVDVIESWHDHPAFLDLLAGRVRGALEPLGRKELARSLVVFTAHSLPARIVDEGDPYPRQVRATADAVAERLGLPSVAVAWQSAARTGEPWLVPTLDDVVRGAAVGGAEVVVVCPCGFVADHLEILYDLDIEARQTARRAGIRLVRTESLNADPDFVRALAAIVRDHLARPRRSPRPPSVGGAGPSVSRAGPPGLTMYP
ncbi:MAG: ferrochelatase [Acidobacteria bacterium]|nr:ferrochelatase [Acidobacteriota bacterium]